MSKFQLCTTLGDRRISSKPKREFVEFFGSVSSVFRSVRSILGPRVVVDRSENSEFGNCARRIHHASIMLVVSSSVVDARPPTRCAGGVCI